MRIDGGHHFVLPLADSDSTNLVHLELAEEREQPSVDDAVLGPSGGLPDTVISVLLVELHQGSKRHFAAPFLLQQKFTLILLSILFPIKAFLFLCTPFSSPVGVTEIGVPFSLAVFGLIRFY